MIPWLWVEKRATRGKIEPNDLHIEKFPSCAGVSLCGVSGRRYVVLNYIFQKALEPRDLCLECHFMILLSRYAYISLFPSNAHFL